MHHGHFVPRLWFSCSGNNFVHAIIWHPTCWFQKGNWLMHVIILEAKVWIRGKVWERIHLHACEEENAVIYNALQRAMQEKEQSKTQWNETTIPCAHAKSRC